MYPTHNKDKGIQGSNFPVFVMCGMKERSKFFEYFVGCVVILDAIVWFFVIFSNPPTALELYFLKVGQGDSSLAFLPRESGGAAKVLIDGGPLNGNLEGNLAKIFSTGDKYIDLVIISHPEIDHYGGLISVLKNYSVGAVLWNGEDRDDPNWKELNNIIAEKKIRKITLARGDKIVYGTVEADVLNSGDSFAGGNDSGLVILLKDPVLKTLFSADVSADIEKILSISGNIQADILKVAHHGSKYSSSEEFLKAVAPKVSVIEVGKNSYGHPTQETLDRLKDIGTQIFRTDENGILKADLVGDKLKLYTL